MVDKHICVSFGKSNNLTLKWKLRETAIAIKWFNLLKHAVIHGIRESDRFYNLPNQHWNQHTICDALIKCMTAIETVYPQFFKTWPTPTMGEATANILHTDFEKLRGSVFEPSNIWVTADDDLRKEIRLYNVLIHRWESFIKQGPARFVCTFKEKFITDLENDDYNYFSLNHNYGAMLINYPLVGKQFLDLIRDNDWVISKEAIVPMTCFSADFTVRFVDNSFTNPNLSKKIQNWFDTHNKTINELGYTVNDPKLALGWIQVADLILEDDMDSILAVLGELNEIDSVRIEE